MTSEEEQMLKTMGLVLVPLALLSLLVGSPESKNEEDGSGTNHVQEQNRQEKEENKAQDAGKDAAPEHSRTEVARKRAEVLETLREAEQNLE